MLHLSKEHNDSSEPSRARAHVYEFKLLHVEERLNAVAIAERGAIFL